MDKRDITILLSEWNFALGIGEPKKVTALYDSNAILLPTQSKKICRNHEEIEEYFTQFLAKKPTRKIYACMIN